MKTAQLFADQFTRVTTGRKALYGLKNGITLEAVKGILNREGYFFTIKEGTPEEFKEDVESKYLKVVHYNGSNGDVYRPTAKGCKVIFNLLTK